MMNALELDSVRKSFGSLVAVDSVSFGVERGSTVALLGPSGCGKTTALRLIAGFETSEQGTIQIGGVAVNGLRPYERSVGLLFQDYALFPHMTVAHNIRYGMKRRGFAGKDMEERLRAMLNLIQLPHVADRYPNQLSGGQQQRVALARAFAIEPSIMLLDEPLSALDTKLRLELRHELKSILSSVGATTIIVTHDHEEALSLADRIFVMNHGRIAQQGTPREIYEHPQSRFVADFMGKMNWLPDSAKDPLGAFAMKVVGETLQCRQPNDADGWLVGVRPENIVLCEQPADGDHGCFAATIDEVVFLGSEIRVLLQVEGSGPRLHMAQKNIRKMPPSPGSRIYVVISPDDCVVVESEW